MWHLRLNKAEHQRTQQRCITSNRWQEHTDFIQILFYTLLSPHNSGNPQVFSIHDWPRCFKAGISSGCCLHFSRKPTLFFYSELCNMFVSSYPFLSKYELSQLPLCDWTYFNFHHCEGAGHEISLTWERRLWTVQTPLGWHTNNTQLNLASASN